MQSAQQATVVVVGGGLAGCCAAIEAAKGGAQVILLEKEPKLGGNSAKATSGINGWGTITQARHDIVDDGKYFERDTYLSGVTGNCRPELVTMVSIKSSDAIKWLMNLNIPLTVLTQLGGHSRKRTHRAPDKQDGTPMPIGFVIMRRLEEVIRGEFRNSIQVETRARLSRLLHESVTLPSGEKTTVVKGVEYVKPSGDASSSDEERVQVYSSAVVLATGGFSNDHTMNSLLQEYAPHLMGYPTTNGAWATGDGIKLVRELEAVLVDMDKVQLHPTGMINPKDPLAKTVFLGPEALRGSGAILLNKKGKRFVNELGLRSAVSQAIIAQDNEYPNSAGRKFAYCILNEAGAKLFGLSALGFYWKRMGLFRSVENVRELAELIECEERELLQTLQNYHNMSSSGEKCALTGKETFPCVLGPEGPFYVAYVTPSIHYTMGGCLISPSAEILTPSSSDLFNRYRPILGLFGAGEVTGGVHGGNRLAGNSLLECVVFGRIAGERAARAALSYFEYQERVKDLGKIIIETGSWARGTIRQFLPDDRPREGRKSLWDGGSRLVINLPSPFDTSGLALLQPLLLKPSSCAFSGEIQPLQVVPMTIPRELGVVSIVLPPLFTRKHGIPSWLYSLKPGNEVEMQAVPVKIPTLTLNQRLMKIEKESGAELIILAFAPEGVNPMLQLLQASLQLPLREKIGNVWLFYAAKTLPELSYWDILKNHCNEKFGCMFALEDPPPKWTGEVDTDISTIRNHLPITTNPSRSNVVILAEKAERISMIKQFFHSKGFEEGVNLFIILPFYDSN